MYHPHRVRSNDDRARDCCARRRRVRILSTKRDSTLISLYSDINLYTRALDKRSILRERSVQGDASGKPSVPIYAPDRSHEAVGYPGEIKNPPKDNGMKFRFDTAPGPPPDKPLPPTPPRRDTTHGS